VATVGAALRFPCKPAVPPPTRLSVASGEVEERPGAARVAPVAIRPTLSKRWRRGQRGWPASFPVLQFPNAPLLVALAALLVTAVTDDTVHAYARAAFYAALAAWAWGELAYGVSWARRLLGAAGLVFVVLRVGAAFGG
jgi:hypothetical protein